MNIMYLYTQKKKLHKNINLSIASSQQLSRHTPNTKPNTRIMRKSLGELSF